MKKNSILCTLMCLVSLGSLASCGPKTSGSTGSGSTAMPEPEPAKKETLVLSGAEDQRTFVMGKANE